MEISITEQIVACLAFLVLGVGSAVLYTAFRIIYVILFGDDGREVHRRIPVRISEFFFDLIYCAVVCVGIAVTSYAFSWGHNRAVNLIFASLGFASFMLTLGRLILMLSAVISRTVRRILLHIFITAARPICASIKGLTAFSVWLFERTAGALIFRISDWRAARHVDRVIKKQIPLCVRFDIIQK